MRLALFSDLHTEFDTVQWTPPPLEADVIVFAGDNVTSTAQLRMFAETVETRQHVASHIIYICGNHEFYGASTRFGPRGYDKYREVLAPFPRSTMLEMESIEACGVRIVGATLWAPVPTTMDASSNDYRCIRIDKPPYRRLLPIDILAQHKKAVRYLNDELARAVPTVVVTHHPPSSVGLNICPGKPWIADLDSLIEETRPMAWLHGHVHQSHDDRVAQTRILANPRGYFPSHLNSSFDPSFVFEV